MCPSRQPAPSGRRCTGRSTPTWRAPVDPKQAYVDAVAGLGEAGPQIAKDINTWGQGLVTQEVLTPEQLAEVGKLSFSKLGLEALNALRERMVGSAPPPSKQPGGGVTEAELDAMIEDPRYWSDPAYAKRVQELAKHVLGEDAPSHGPAPMGAIPGGVELRI